MSRYTLRRTRLGDGEETTTYVVRHRLAGLSVGVHVFRQARRLDRWCHKQDVHEAVVGGFYLRDPFRPLGDVWCGGEPAAGTPFLPAYRGEAHFPDPKGPGRWGPTTALRPCTSPSAS